MELRERIEHGGLAHPADAGFGWEPDLSDWHGRIELQVRLDPARHDDDALRLAQVLGSQGFVGSRARWIGPDFVACWELEPDAAPDPPPDDSPTDGAAVCKLCSTI